MVAQADVMQALQLFAAPHPSGRVVGVAEQEGAHLGVGGAALEVVEVDVVGAVGVDKRAVFHHAAVVADGGEEAVVHRALYEHLVARQREGLDDGRDGGHHTGGVDDPLALYGPLVAAGEPTGEGLIVGVAHLAVAEHPVLHPAAQGVDDGVGHTEVHVGHPHGQCVGPALGGVPFHAA